MSLLDQPLVNRLGDGRIQLRHGPIDLIIEAFGSPAEVELACQQATESFATVLSDLVAELSDLRKPHGTHATLFQGDIAMAMAGVAEVFAVNRFVTPMIAVAGAVADHILHDMTKGRVLTRAYVNNGGDIALYLNKHQSFNVGVCANPLDGTVVSTATIDERSEVRGIATSGWRGRSHSMGIADSVTVLARTAAMADSAATLIANAIDLPDHPMIKRKPACELAPDSDLGNRMVTVDVKGFTVEETHRALESGHRVARTMIEDGLISAVYGCLNTHMFSVDAAGFDPLIPRACVEVPVTHRNAAYARSHFDSIEVGLNEAPETDEMPADVVMKTDAPVYNRAGSLNADDIRGEDTVR